MSTPRYDWWGYIKGMVRRYPAKCTQREKEAVEAALAEVEKKPSHTERLTMIRVVFWDKTHTLAGAAMLLHCSYETAKTWHTDFLRSVAKNFGLF